MPYHSYFLICISLIITELGFCVYIYYLYFHFCELVMSLLTFTFIFGIVDFDEGFLYFSMFFQCAFAL